MRQIVISVAVGLFTAALASNLAVAQQIKEVTVKASRFIEKEIRRTATGIPIVNVSLAYGVSYADLDLASRAGVMELEKRVNDAAQEACSELGRQYPHASPSDAKCAKTAADKTMAKVHELAAAAAKAPGK